MPKMCPYCGDCPPEEPCGCLASEDVAALRAKVNELEAEVSKWRKSFGGHVYVTNEKYSGLIALLLEAARVSPEKLATRIYQALA